jgi:organic radical activating enzyme
MVNLAREVQRKIPDRWWHPLLVITGGEPFRQNIAGLINYYCDSGWQVQIETNGIHLPLDVNEIAHELNLTIVCSPKTKINDKFKPFIGHLKYILDHRYIDPEDGLPTHSLGMDARPERPWPGFLGEVWVQPIDTGYGGGYFSPSNFMDVRNVQACVDSCKKFGYRISLQTHKLLGLT